MENFITQDVFKNGLSRYLKKFAYQSTTQDDLWESLTEEARKSNIFDEKMSVKTIMDGWTLQTGFPYVTVIRNYEKDFITLEQKRFRLIELNVTENTDNEEENPLWWIPITYTTSRELNFNNTRPSHWMKAEREIILEHVVDSKDWLILNIQVTGYYRVKYDEANWRLIIKHLNDPMRFHEISQSNRAQLLDDAMNFARSKLLDYQIALDLTKYLTHERDYVPWKSAINNLIYIDAMLILTPDYDKMKVSIQQNIRTINMLQNYSINFNF